MSYIPKLKYIFCEPRVYQTEWYMPLFRYLNRLGRTPRILAGDEDVIQTLRDHKITFEPIRELPGDYDILLTNSSTYLPFGRYWLEKSMKKGKINVFAFQLPIPYTYESENFKAKTMKFTHAVCAADERTIENVRRHNKEVIYLNTGYIVYDQLQTNEFKEEVKKIKYLYGDKLLVIAVDRTWPEEITYVEKIIESAHSLGFQVVLQVKHIVGDNLPEHLKQYVNPGFSRFALFQAASHLIGFLLSTVTIEGMYLGTKVGCKPLGIKDGVWGQWHWFESAQHWRESTLPYFGNEYSSFVPLIHDEQTIQEFLCSQKKPFTQEEVYNYFRWPKVDSYTEHTFRMIDAYFGEGNKESVQKILRKNELVKDIVDYFGWDCERAGKFVEHINDPKVLVDNGIRFLEEKNLGAASTCLKIADKFSGTNSTQIIQFALAQCYYLANNCDEAGKYIYRALLLNPDCKEFQQLKRKIDENKETEKTAVPS